MEKQCPKQLMMSSHQWAKMSPFSSNCSTIEVALVQFGAEPSLGFSIIFTLTSILGELPPNQNESRSLSNGTAQTTL